MPNWVKNNLTLKGTRAELQAFRDKCCPEFDQTHFNAATKSYEPTGEKFRTFDFATLVPRPEGFDENIGSPVPLEVEALFNDARRVEIESYPWVLGARPEGGWTKEGLIAFLVTRKNNLSPDEVTEAVKKVGELAMACATNVKLTGHPTWYEWNTHNWGTKWNACDADIGEIQPVDASFPNELSSPDDPCTMTLYFETAWGMPEPIYHAIAAQFPNIKIDGTVDEEGGFFYADITDNVVTDYRGIREGGPYDYSDDEEDEEQETLPAPDNGNG